MVKEYENFITDEECQFMIEAAQKQFMRTTTLGFLSSRGRLL